MSDKSLVFLGLIIFIGLFYSKSRLALFIIAETLLSYYLSTLDKEIYILSTGQIIIYGMAFYLIKNFAIRTAYTLLLFYYSIDFAANSFYSVYQTRFWYDIVYFLYSCIDSIWFVSVGWIILGMFKGDDSGSRYRNNGLSRGNNNNLLYTWDSELPQSMASKTKGMG